MNSNDRVTGGVTLLGLGWSVASTWNWPMISYIVGTAVAVIGLLLGFLWSWRRDKREREIMLATLESLRSKGVVINDENVLD